MLRQPVGHARLMRESVDRVQNASSSTDVQDALVARRILENPLAWSHWENEHSMLMRQLADCASRNVQVAALKHATFRLMHGKALFQYLRRAELRGRDRARVMAHFRPGRHYSNAIVAEHNVYLRKACSYMCASHLGAAVVDDPSFIDPIPRYEALYQEYFGVYCATLLDKPDAAAVSQSELLPLLKAQLNEYRWAILDPRRAQPFLRREADLRAATGDTQRMPAMGGRTRRGG